MNNATEKIAIFWVLPDVAEAIVGKMLFCGVGIVHFRFSLLPMVATGQEMVGVNCKFSSRSGKTQGIPLRVREN